MQTSLGNTPLNKDIPCGSSFASSSQQNAVPIRKGRKRCATVEIPTFDLSNAEDMSPDAVVKKMKGISTGETLNFKSYSSLQRGITSYNV